MGPPERQPARVIAQNPTDPDARFMFSAFRTIAGHLPEGIDAAERLAPVDSLSPMGSFSHSTGAYFAGRWAEALGQDSAVKQIDPTMAYFDVIFTRRSARRP